MVLNIVDRRANTIRKVRPWEFDNDIATKTITIRAWERGKQETIHYDVAELMNNWEEVTVYASDISCVIQGYEEEE